MRTNPIHPPSEDLFAYRDGELVPEKRALIEAHVMGCSLCRTFIDQVSSLEAELRQSPDRAPEGYMEVLQESVRQRLASERVLEEAQAKEAAARSLPAPGMVPHGGRVGGYREPGRTRAERASGEDGRVKDVPRFPWAAVVSTASAAAAVVVVAVILIRQGIYEQGTMPVLMRNRQVAQAPPADSQALMQDRDQNAPATTSNKKEAAPPSAQAPGEGATVGSSTIQVGGREGAKLQDGAKDVASRAKVDERLDAYKERADRLARENASELRTEEAPAPSAAAPEAQERARALLKSSDTVQRSTLNQVGSAEAYDALMRRLGLPARWTPGIPADKLRRAVPELRLFYLSGAAGRDSARLRLYLAEATRLNYASGDSELYEEIERHYRRAIELAGPDAETARTAEERLRTLQR